MCPLQWLCPLERIVAASVPTQRSLYLKQKCKDDRRQINRCASHQDTYGPHDSENEMLCLESFHWNVSLWRTLEGWFHPRLKDPVCEGRSLYGCFLHNVLHKWYHLEETRATLQLELLMVAKLLQIGVTTSPHLSRWQPVRAWRSSRGDITVQAALI